MREMLDNKATCGLDGRAISNHFRVKVRNKLTFCFEMTLFINLDLSQLTLEGKRSTFHSFEVHWLDV